MKEPNPTISNPALQAFRAAVVAASLISATGIHNAKAAETPLEKTIADIDKTIAQGPYKPNWESLKPHVDPEWFRDAKFGIYTHWGPVTVGTEGGGAQWYGRSMYERGTPSFNQHLKNFGDQKTVGFKDIIPKLTAEKFNADAWADLFARAGAKFAGPVAVHHDNFAMWDSQLTRWNSVGMGPHRDITGELEKSIRARGMKFITTFHHGYAWRYFEPSFKYDGADPQNSDLYTEAHDPKDPPSKHFQDQWLAMVYEVLNKYQPDLIWFDFEFFKVIQPEYQQKLFATAYKWAEQNNRTIGVCQKDWKIHVTTGILDFERGREDRLVPYPWLTDSAVGEWFCQKSAARKSVDQLVDMLVDIVSKNGCLLLNVGPQVDGTIPDQDREALLGMGDWLKVNGEAIYSTRPWKIYGEGPTRQAKAGGFSEFADKPFTAHDIRFTQSKDGKTVYATSLGAPEDGKMIVKSLASGAGKISAVSLLGYLGKLDWKQTDAALEVTLPNPVQHAVSIKIIAEDLKPMPVFYEITSQPAADGSLVLSANDAKIQGETLRKTQDGGRVRLGSWSNPDDFVSWSFKIDHPGTLEVEITYSCAAPGSEFTVEMGKQHLEGKTVSTGSWSKYRTDVLGVLYIEKPGQYTVSLKPKPGQKWNDIGLNQLAIKRIQ